jgi:predicted phosphodiesterase
MRVAVINDIHGNLPALEAVLAEIRQMHVDRVVVGGDVLPGPMPRETLARLLNLEVPVDFLYGNGEVAVLEQLAGKIPALVPEPYRPLIRWTAEQLDPEQQRTIASWPMTVCLEIEPLGEVLFCHATPHNENDLFTLRTPEDRLLPIFDGVAARVVVCGHSHMQFDRMVGSIRVVNAGSVGMPWGDPGADWLLLGPSGQGVELRHTAYDLAHAAARIRETTYPEAQHFADTYVLQPPSAQQMLDLYSNYELK